MDTYNKFIRRVSGVGTFHTFDSGDIIPRQLPFAFRSWQEYRDYLLVNIVKPGIPSYSVTAGRIKPATNGMRPCQRDRLNDIDGTNNANAAPASVSGKRRLPTASATPAGLNNMGSKK